jgi:hypothetical protein
MNGDPQTHWSTMPLDALAGGIKADMKLSRFTTWETTVTAWKEFGATFV